MGSALKGEKGRGMDSKRGMQGVGVEQDWGKARPFWCLSCGRGHRSVERVLAHYSKAGHGNESMIVGSRGLSRGQQIEAFRLRHR